MAVATVQRTSNAVDAPSCTPPRTSHEHRSNEAPPTRIVQSHPHQTHPGRRPGTDRDRPEVNLGVHSRFPGDEGVGLSTSTWFDRPFRPGRHVRLSQLGIPVQRGEGPVPGRRKGTHSEGQAVPTVHGPIMDRVVGEQPRRRTACLREVGSGGRASQGTDSVSDRDRERSVSSGLDSKWTVEEGPGEIVPPFSDPRRASLLSPLHSGFFPVRNSYFFRKPSRVEVQTPPSIPRPSGRSRVHRPRRSCIRPLSIPLRHIAFPSSPSWREAPSRSGWRQRGAFRFPKAIGFPIEPDPRSQLFPFEPIG